MRSCQWWRQLEMAQEQQQQQGVWTARMCRWGCLAAAVLLLVLLLNHKSSQGV